MEFEEFIEDYPDLEDFLKRFIDEDLFVASFDSDKLKIKISNINKTIIFNKKDLETLASYKKIKGIRGLDYLGSHGYRYDRFYEIALNVTHPNYTFFDDTNDWKAKPLSFKIGDNQFVLGSASPLFVLLTEPVFSEKDYHYDFDRFATIILVLHNNNDYQLEIIKALYYLNSHYLKEIGFVATINHLQLKNEDPLRIMYDYDIEDIFSKASRVRTRTSVMSI